MCGCDVGSSDESDWSDGSDLSDQTDGSRGAKREKLPSGFRALHAYSLANSVLVHKFCGRERDATFNRVIAFFRL